MEVRSTNTPQVPTFDGAYDYANEKEAFGGRPRIDLLLENKFSSQQSYGTITTRGKMLRKWESSKTKRGDLHILICIFQYPEWWMDAARETASIAKVPIMETWQAMEKLVDEGLVRSIGVSNIDTQLLYDVISYARHPISSLRIEHQLYFVRPQLVAMAQEECIVVTGYSTFRPQSFLELPPAFGKRAADVPMLFDTEIIKKLASKYERGPGQVLLRWATQRGIAVILKSNNEDRLKQNLEFNDFSMTNEELEEISGLDRGLKFNDPGSYLQNRPIPIFN